MGGFCYGPHAGLMREGGRRDFGMKRVLVILSISIGGWIGWRLGKYFGFMTAYFLSVVGAAAGLYFGRKIMRHYLE
jgi:hypothetical protein